MIYRDKKANPPMIFIMAGMLLGGYDVYYEAGIFEVIYYMLLSKTNTTYRNTTAKIPKVNNVITADIIMLLFPKEWIPINLSVILEKKSTDELLFEAVYRTSIKFIISPILFLLHRLQLHHHSSSNSLLYISPFL